MMKYSRPKAGRFRHPVVTAQVQRRGRDFRGNFRGSQPSLWTLPKQRLLHDMDRLLSSGLNVNDS